MPMKELRILTRASMNRDRQLLDFATIMAKRAFTVRNDFVMKRFMTMLDHLYKWDVLPPRVLEERIDALNTLRRHKDIVKIYRKMRETKYAFTPTMLDKIMKIFSMGQSTRGIQEVLDDWFRCFRRPSRLSYKFSMTAFAARRDVNTGQTAFRSLHDALSFEGPA